MVGDGTTNGVTRKRVNGAAKGAEFERKLADYFVSLGYKDARRMIRTGTVKHADEGDIDGLPFVVQAKTQAKLATDAQIARWRAETFAQQEARDLPVGLLVVKRNGYADPGMSWVYMNVAEVAWLFGAYWDGVETLLRARDAPVRVALRDLAPSLLAKYPPK